MRLNWINRRTLLIAGGVILVAIIVLLVILLPKSCGSASSLERDNTLKLIQRYIERGEFDRAMNLLDGLLIKNADDTVALAMIDEVIALKAGAKLSDFPRYTQDISVNTADLERALGKMNEELAKNSAAVERALRNQNEQAQQIANAAKQQEEAARQQAEIARQQAENARREAEAQEEAKRQKELQAQEEAKRKAKEEELARKNKALQEQISKVNDEISIGKAKLGMGEIDSALSHFENASKMLPVEEKKFSANKLSEIATAIYDASVNQTSSEVKKTVSCCLSA